MTGLRVLHLVAARQRRGAEIAAADLIEALGALGVDQRVVALRDGDFRFPAPTAVVGSGRRMPGLRLDPGATRRLRALARDWPPHVLQAHGGEAFKHAVAAGGRMPVVYRRIGWAPPWAHRGLRRMAHARLLAQAGALICVAEAVRRETIDVFGVPADRVVTIPNALDERRLRPVRDRAATRQALGVPATAPVLLSLGALVWEKAPRAHVEVGVRVRRSLPDVVHLIAGDGPLRRGVEEDVRGAGDGTRLLGSIDEVADLLAAADCLLMASRSEGMPNVLIEAGFAGLPAAAFDVAGVREVVEDGVTGMLAPAGDVDALAGAAAKLMGDPAVRLAMGEAARERCRSLFDVSAVAPRYLEIYRELSAR